MTITYLKLLAGLVGFLGVANAQEAPGAQIPDATKAESKNEETKSEAPKADKKAEPEKDDAAGNARKEAWKKRMEEFKGRRSGDIHPPQAAMIFDVIDVNADGTVSEEEFLVAAKEHAKKIFARVDANQDGKVQKEEADKAAAAVGEKCKAMREKMGGERGGHRGFGGCHANRGHAGHRHHGDKPPCDKPDCDKPDCDKPDCDKPDCDKPDCDKAPGHGAKPACDKCEESAKDPDHGDEEHVHGDEDHKDAAPAEEEPEAPEAVNNPA